MERHASPRSAITKRLQTGKGYTGRHLEWLLDWLLDWEVSAFEPGRAATLLNSRPVISPTCERHITSRIHDGKFQEEEYAFQVNDGFRGRHLCDPGLGQILSECDGMLTWHEHYERALAERRIPVEATAEEFTGLLTGFVADGILRIPEETATDEHG
jgi:hypothetical protein